MSATWILVFNASNARLFRESRDHGLELLGTRVNPWGRVLTHAMVSDRPGRAAASGGARVTLDGGTDPAVHTRDHFARELGLLLHNGVSEGQCDRVVLVAPPKMLGSLRHHLDARVADRVVESIDADLAVMEVDQIPAQLARSREARRQPNAR
jgi:protein required for attachment to host cells